MTPVTPLSDIPEYRSLTKPLTEETGDLAFYEIPCGDMDRAMNFYNSVFGWNPHPDMGILPGHRDGIEAVTCFVGQGNMRGGFTKVQDPTDLVHDEAVLRKALPTVSVRTENIDTTMARVVENGGRIHLSKVLIYGGKMGATARFIDTEGNVCSVWQPPIS